VAARCAVRVRNSGSVVETVTSKDQAVNDKDWARNEDRKTS
jgi:hypothetical protein